MEIQKEIQNRLAAEKIFSAVKKAITAARRSNKANGFTSPDDYAWKRQSVYINARENYTVLKSGKRRLSGFAVTVEGKNVFEFKQIADLESAFWKLKEVIQEQSCKRNWTRLEFKKDKISLYDGSRYDTDINIISVVVLQPDPCKEFDALKAYINRHAPGTDLGYMELYSVSMNGKKGYLYDEAGENDYLENHPARCRKFLQEIKKAKTSRDVMGCRYDKETWMDPDEYETSSIEQIECSGEKRHYLRVVIKSPTGKIKYDKKLF